ncbi:hypothetical protein C3414_08475 [Serratia sp. SSNIH2]|nr:hypothetical protein C3F38_23515 [Serratia sp. SSNIH1]AVU36968.1 hypothetical protein AM681_21170 [Serratia marcescens]OFS88266.1 hypothetical protein HMPREF3138_15975 [Serratia sp. HMSC15F11]POU55194.1 hypothetical protein C3401_07390 [Serratia sp. SSNIH4]POW34251.1 hypothetical protein C3396_20850 [Serratia sp. SSNIH5]POW40034.1 hypothetical protein C3414_08475 [Serratia sp. SSNIH2]POW62074.1 hypothetical protein C3403_07995 [Serratia sp. SSNIH3]
MCAIKYITSIVALNMMFSASAFAAKQITLEESASYTKLGDLSIQQTGVPTVGHKYISAEVDKKCNELSGLDGKYCFYRIISATGQESDHKDIHVEIFKK